MNSNADIPSDSTSCQVASGNPDLNERSNSWLSEMTLEEKIELISGRDIFFTKGVPRLGVRSVRMANASMGLQDADVVGTAFPASICLAATWSREMARAYGDALGAEFRAANVDVVLGPGVNICRVSQCGRNFEYLGEDPLLAGTIAREYIRAVQSRGVAATVKHFVANNSDWHRCASNTVVDERALREIYLPAFETAVRDAGVLSLMTSYNLVNGEYTAESARLLQGIVVNEWGFSGLIMSDWCGVWSAEKAFESGLHLEMPDAKVWKTEVLTQLLGEDRIDLAELDRKVTAILRWTSEIEALRERAPAGRRRCADHLEVALNVARQGIVLLKNRSGILPLSSEIRSLNVLGPRAFPTPISGGGAAKIDVADTRSVLGALLEAAPHIDIRRGENGMSDADAVVVCVGFDHESEAEGFDRTFELPWEQQALVRKCVDTNPNTVVIVFAGAGVGMDTWIDDAAAVLFSWYPGEIGAQAVAEILFGHENPSGRLPISIERVWRDSPAFGNYLPDGADLYDTPDFVDRVRPIFDIPYREGIFCGYRGHDRNGTNPLFPFGFGLSYTTFDYFDLNLRCEDGGVLEVHFTVRNSGMRKGAEVAQVYVSDLECSHPRPFCELKGFERIELQPGDAKRMCINLTKRDFSFYNAETGTWEMESGQFVIRVGSSSRDFRLEQQIQLDAWE